MKDTPEMIEKRAASLREEVKILSKPEPKWLKVEEKLNKLYILYYGSSLVKEKERALEELMCAYNNWID